MKEKTKTTVKEVSDMETNKKIINVPICCHRQMELKAFGVQSFYHYLFQCKLCGNAIRVIEED